MAYTPKASKAELEKLYFKQKQSPEKIAQIYGCHPRSVRAWMYQYGIKLLGASHLVTGRPAPWNKKPKPQHVIDALRASCIGRTPHNKGKGVVHFSVRFAVKKSPTSPIEEREHVQKLAKTS